jgi:hypothetical protein
MYKNSFTSFCKVWILPYQFFARLSTALHRYLRVFHNIKFHSEWSLSRFSWNSSLLCKESLQKVSWQSNSQCPRWHQVRWRDGSDLNIRIFPSKRMLNNVLILAYWSKVYNSLTKMYTIRLSHLCRYPPTATDPVETVVSAQVEWGSRAASWSFSWNTMSNYITTHLVNRKEVSLLRNC